MSAPRYGANDEKLKTINGQTEEFRHPSETDFCCLVMTKSQTMSDLRFVNWHPCTASNVLVTLICHERIQDINSHKPAIHSPFSLGTAYPQTFSWSKEILGDKSVSKDQLVHTAIRPNELTQY